LSPTLLADNLLALITLLKFLGGHYFKNIVSERDNSLFNYTFSPRIMQHLVVFVFYCVYKAILNVIMTTFMSRSRTNYVCSFSLLWGDAINQCRKNYGTQWRRKGYPLQFGVYILLH